MPRLPDTGALGATPIPSAPGSVATYRPSSGAETATGQAMVGVGQQVEREGELYHQAQKIEQEKLDTTRAEDLWNQYRNAALDLSVGEKGFAQKRGADAVNGNLLLDYSAKLADVRKRLEGTLTTPEQKTKFAQRANATDLQYKNQILHHYTAELPKYEQTVYEGAVQSAAALVASAPTDQMVFDTAMLNVSRRADALAERMGITDAGAIAIMKGSARDTLITKRIDSMLYRNAPAAEALFRLLEKDIANPELRLNLSNRTREASLFVRAATDAVDLIAETRSAPPPASRATPEGGPSQGLVGAVIRQESGGNASAVSPKDARGLMQILPATAKAVAGRMGLKYDEAMLNADTPAGRAYNVKLGTAYLDEQLQRFGGNQTLALAAYNAGPEAVEDWVKGTNKSGKNASKLKIGDPNTGEISDADFAARIPFKETRDYVAKINAASPPGASAIAPSTNGLPNSRDVRAQLPVMLSRVEDRATAIYGPNRSDPNRIAYVSKLTSEIKSRVADEAMQLDTIQRQAQGQIIDAVAGFTAPGGGAVTRAGMRPVSSFSEIQSNPDLLRAWQLMDPQAKLAISRLIEQNANAEGKPTKGDDKLYWDVWKRIHLDPGDPNKIDFYQQILQFAGPGQLNTQQIGQLRQEIDRAETPGGRSVSQLMRNASSRVETYFKTHMMFTSQPDRQIAATMRWSEDVGKKIDEYVRAGKDTRPLFQIDSPESVVNPKYLDMYVNSTPSQGVATAAATARAEIPQAPSGLKTNEEKQAWVNSLPAGVTSFRDDAGVVRQIPGRAAPPASAPAAPSYGPRNDGTPKGTGYFGELKRPDGKVSTELSIGVQIDGKEREIPLLVPTLTAQEVDHALAEKKPTAGMVQKAVDHAKQRIAAGKDPFAQAGEQQGRPATDSEPELVDAALPRRATRALQPASDQGERVTETRTGGMSPEQVARRDAISKDIKSIAEKAIYIYSGRFVLEALRDMAANIPTEPERLARAFRDVVKGGRYTVQAEPLIQEALERGLLSPDEQAQARRMLAKIEEKRGR